MTLPQQKAKAILPYVGILWGKGDETLFGQASSKTVVIRGIAPGINHVAGSTFESVLAHHNGPALSIFEVLGDQQNSKGKNVFPDVQHDFIASELWLIINEACTRVHWQIGVREPAYHF